VNEAPSAYCHCCGTRLPEGAAFCPSCGCAVATLHGRGSASAQATTLKTESRPFSSVAKATLAIALVAIIGTAIAFASHRRTDAVAAAAALRTYNSVTARLKQLQETQSAVNSASLRVREYANKVRGDLSRAMIVSQERHNATNLYTAYDDTSPMTHGISSRDGCHGVTFGSLRTAANVCAPASPTSFATAIFPRGSSWPSHTTI
jgi:hypothetical protein